MYPGPIIPKQKAGAELWDGPWAQFIGQTNLKN